ncbi:hypothetical protein [Actinoplanes subtropicus]|uniref:hypothetical protein n=1 Tax=Actinoplanes subtropicus TaxID=543632 RepID=UPI000A8A719E|nr:hypothetical protein [Actinoplanes subtropicus]
MVQWESYGPAADLCWAFARAEGAGGGSWPEMFAALPRDFPELAEIVAPPPPPPPPERDAVRRKREAQEHQEQQWRLADLKRTWGGRIPSNPRLLEPKVSARTLGLVPYDRDLIDLVADAEPADQRRMAVWAARYCCTRSGLIARDWAEAGLDALENGDPPPPWFADHDAAFARLFDVPRESITHTVSFSIGDAEPTPRIDPEILAIHTVVMARDADPLIAAMDTVRNAVALDPDSAPLPSAPRSVGHNRHPVQKGQDDRASAIGVRLSAGGLAAGWTGCWCWRVWNESTVPGSGTARAYHPDVRGLHRRLPEGRHLHDSR